MGTTPAERIRAQAREATRRALLEAGLAETVERDGEVPSVETVCKRAGYTRGAFYSHFETREQFVGEMLDWVLTDIVRSLFLTATEETAGLQEVVDGFAEALSRREWPDLRGDIRAGYMAILRELRPGSSVRERHAQLMEGIVRRLEELIRDGQDTGTIRADADPRPVAMLLLLTAIGAIVWDGVGIRTDIHAVAGSALGLLAPAERPSPGDRDGS